MATLDLPLSLRLDGPGRVEEAARLGDREAWNTLVARHNHRLVVALVGQGVPAARAREVAQEAWLRLIRQAQAQRLDRLELPGLVIRQALFLARSEARRERALPADEPAPVESAEASYLSRERLAGAQAVLATCSRSAQKVFSLLYAEPHLTHAEVAAQVGLSTQRVRQILCEVRKKLRASLEGDDDVAG
jgi:RNA polymerase sigma-70 factor (ECF subfamily)